ncbi:MAG TPA: sigma 54-interacting transcriptional regulator [Gammaproteobacteria bacterium]|nr:sigma 54-interacting transcriptional regulator [Gammaproteobacteria bacterium]
MLRKTTGPPVGEGESEQDDRVRFGVQAKLGLSVLVAILVSGLIIAGTLDVFGRDRVYRANLGESEAMVQAASLAFSQALQDKDAVLLDALVHELQSRRDLHIHKAYVLDTTGRVVAHSISSEYGKHYPVPALLRAENPPRLSQVIASGAPTFKVVSLLQAQGHTLGALVVQFSTEQLDQRLHSELVWVLGTTLPTLSLTGLGLLLFGRGMVKRLVTLRSKILAVGRGQWAEPVVVRGRDEIASLGAAFNQMRRDLDTLDEKDRTATGTIKDLNRELNAQLHTVESLKERLAEENADLRRRLSSMGGDREFIGRSAPVVRLLEQAEQTAPLPINVLVTGESGTGKELLANFLHKHGDRADGPFVKVNCAALPTTLLESELFGHEKGAFTGATGQRKGKFELAHGGTLFLDEIGELPLESQAKLLRALQQGEIQRVGGNAPIIVDVRLVAATNRTLADEVSQGRFREDLYYRLKVIELYCPALRERADDLPVLAQHFVEHFSGKLGRAVVGISPGALQRLHEYPWPGNVRELEHAIARAVALAETRVLGPEDFGFLPGSSPKPGQGRSVAAGEGFEPLLAACGLSPDGMSGDLWDTVTEACERVCLITALGQTANQKEAAALLGITPTKMHRLVKKYRLKHT